MKATSKRILQYDSKRRLIKLLCKLKIKSAIIEQLSYYPSGTLIGVDPADPVISVEDFDTIFKVD
jgi:hypothetical protein